MSRTLKVISTGPEGKPYFGISLRQYDARTEAWIIEYLNVSYNFLRRQINARTGSVVPEGNTVTVTAVSEKSISRKHYTMQDPDHFTYGIDLSNDGDKAGIPIRLLWF